MSNPNGSVENQNAGGNMKSEDRIHEILDEKRFPWERDYPQSVLHTGQQNKTDCICLRPEHSRKTEHFENIELILLVGKFRGSSASDCSLAVFCCL